MARRKASGQNESIYRRDAETQRKNKKNSVLHQLSIAVTFMNLARGAGRERREMPCHHSSAPGPRYLGVSAVKWLYLLGAQNPHGIVRCGAARRKVAGHHGDSEQ
jgi:hypothetical protein